jgi:hypothetical protein
MRQKVIPAAVAIVLLSVLFVWVAATDDSSGSAGDDAPGEVASSPTEPTESPDDTSPSLRPSLIQVRSDEGTRTVALRVTNTGDDSFTVDAIRLVWPGVPETAWTPKGSVFAPGQAIDLKIQYGDPDCNGYPALPQRPPVVQLRIDGVAEVVTEPLDSAGAAWLRRLYVDECREQVLRAIVDVRLAGPWTRVELAGTPYLRGWVDLERVGDSREPVTVTSVFGSILLAFEAVDAGRPVATLDGAQQSLRIPVRIGSSNRCDDHGLSGATQTFLLSVFVRHGTTPVQRLIVTPPVSVQDRALDVAHDACKGDDG